MEEIKLGDRARDTITGFEGIVIAETQWLHGCRRLTLQPEKLGKDGEVPRHESFDAPQLELVKTSAKAQGSRATGGPREDLPRR